MPLHLVKLCVGIESVDHMREHVTAWVANDVSGVGYHHVTRMTPKRVSELTAGGSLYWVIRGSILARQTIRDVESFVDAGGTSRCRILLDASVVNTRPRARKPFQGWRYLADGDAPEDLMQAEGGDDLPEHVARALDALGLL